MTTPKRTSGIFTGIAGVHFVVSELSRRGMIALPTVRNMAAYDVIVVSANGKHHANIQVKTSSKRRTFWPMPPSTKVRSGKDDYYVLLRRIERQRKYEAFMLTGQEAKREVSSEERRQRKMLMLGKKRSGSYPSIYVPGKRERLLQQWATDWDKFRL